MIINIRGTNGSGKSTLVRGLLGVCSKVKPIRGALGNNRPEAYQCELDGVGRPIYILGPYQTNIGGCDRIRPYDLILNLLNKYAPRGHLVFEGLLVSDNYGRVGEWLETMGATVIYLDTPLEQCLASISERTEDAGTKHVERKFNEIRKVRGWFLSNGKVQVVDVSRQNGLERLIQFLRQAT